MRETFLQRQEAQKWGAKVIQQLEKDLKIAYPNLKGYSYRNLNYMRKFAFEYPDFEFVQPPVAQITWAHNIILMDKCKDLNQRF
jgi:predicted nuclease of restriction endonuclease-like (RecB) superfamily